MKIVPAYDARTDLPQAMMQSAIVVGPKGEEVYCDQMGRVKIRFPGTRAADHKHAEGSGASSDDSDSAWVRVASNWAGNGPGSVDQCGTVGLPRVGTEVLVNFLGGDPDKPVIVGQLYNQQAQPPALSDRGDLPGNRYLSGIKSREVKGSRANQLRFDDTHGEISAQLSSDHGASQLNLGFLTQPKTTGFGEARGQGAELRSDMGVAVRGTGGVLVTAEASTQDRLHLDCSEMTSLAQSLQKIADQLSKLAATHSQDAADGPHASELVRKLMHLEKQAAQVVAIFGPDGTFVGSGQALLIDGLKGVDISSGAHARIGSSGMTSIRAANGISLFANEGGAKLISAAGRVQMQAQSEGMELLAKRVLELISVSDWINIRAKQGVRISGGGSEIVIDAQGIRGQTNGKHEMYAGAHQTFGPRAASSNLHREFPQLSKLLTEKTWIEIALVDGSTPVSGERYRLTDAEGNIHEGSLDSNGVARIESIVSGHCKLEFPDLGQTSEVLA